MAYAYQLVQNIVDHNTDFRILYDQSYPEFEKGTWDWRFAFKEYHRPKGELEQIKTYEEKYSAFVNFCQSALFDYPNNCWGFIIYKDDIPVSFSLLSDLIQSNKKRVVAIASLYGKDSTGSKSWLYDPEYKTLNMLFCRDYIGVEEHAVDCVKTGPHYTYSTAPHEYTVAGLYSWYEERNIGVPYDETIEMTTIVFRYPTVEEIPPLENLPWRTDA